MVAGSSNSITARNQKAAKSGESLLWHALCNHADTATAYMDHDCIVVNPLLHPGKSFEALSAQSSPTLREALDRLANSKRRWTAFTMHERDPEPSIAQVELMAVTIMYKITLIRERRRRHHGSQADGDPNAGGGENDLETVDAFVTSTWRQGVSSNYKLCAQSFVPVLD